VVESDELRDRQKEFRRLLEGRHVLDRFGDDKSLEQGVVVALSNWKLEQYGVTLEQIQESRPVQIATTGLWSTEDEHFQKIAAALEALSQRVLAIEAGSIRGDRSQVANEIVQLQASQARCLAFELAAPDELPSPALRQLAGHSVSTLGQLFERVQFQGLLVQSLPRGFDPTVAALINDHVARLLDVDISEILFRAWRKSPELREVRDREAHEAAADVLVPLTEHAVDFTSRPELRIEVRGVRVGKLSFDVKLTLRVSGCVLRMRAGEIVNADVGQVKAHGTIKIGGMLIAEIETEQVPDLGPRLASAESYRARKT
jgi:hypothetical protein